MNYQVAIKRKAARDLAKVPKMERSRFYKLIADLEKTGPVQKDWPNFSPLAAGEYHCHLSYHWVACWRHEAGTIEIEVYYVGSRENAPY